MRTGTGRKRLLVFGAGGQVGTELLRHGPAHGFETIGLTRQSLDITNAAAIREAIRRSQPDGVINAAAYTAVDLAESEPELAHEINGQAPGLAGEACAAAAVPVFHLSTDYVFDGEMCRPYKEDDTIAPLSVYGRSKAEGEDRLRRAAERHIILRTAWVFSPYGRNFVKTMLRLASERETLSVVDDQYGSPTSAADIARTLLSLAARTLDQSRHGGQPLWGTYHFCSVGSTTWHGFAQAIMKRAASYGTTVPLVQAIGTADYPTPARRPGNSALDCSLIQQRFGIEPRDWRLALDETMDELLAPGAQHRQTGGIDHL